MAFGMGFGGSVFFDPDGRSIGRRADGRGGLCGVWVVLQDVS